MNQLKQPSFVADNDQERAQALRASSFAETIESSLQGFTAQCWQWDDFPAFGSLVTIQARPRTLFGIVHQIHTGSMDPMRSPFPYRKTEEELLREQPQIFEFLKTTFSCITVGYQGHSPTGQGYLEQSPTGRGPQEQGSSEQNSMIYQLCPQPPKIHAFVQQARHEDYQAFFAYPHYLPVLFGMSGIVFNLDELLLAVIKNLEDHKLMTPEKVRALVASFSLLTGNDYRRLKLFMQRLEPILTNNNQQAAMP